MYFLFTVQWVYNILNGTSEADRVLYKDPHPVNGFVILPDLKWDSQDIDSLYVIAIVNRRDVLSLRDVNGEHLELLRSIRRKGKVSVTSMLYSYMSVVEPLW